MTVDSKAGRAGRLSAEFLGLYGLVPLAIAVFLPPRLMFAALFLMTGVALALLHATPGFRWGELLRGTGRVGWRPVLGFALATAAISIAAILATRPDAAFGLIRERPRLLAMIVILYPVLSALPQELVFRPLFFRRYGALLPGGWRGIAANAATFSFAHLMYWNWIVVALTFAGGLVFAAAYERQGSFPLAVVLHSVAGWVIFAVGLGVFFYSGNVVRPF